MGKTSSTARQANTSGWQLRAGPDRVQSAVTRLSLAGSVNNAPISEATSINCGFPMLIVATKIRRLTAG